MPKTRNRSFPLFSEIAKHLYVSTRKTLPVKREILSAIVYQKDQSGCTYAQAVKSIVNDVKIIWQRTLIPTITEERMIKVANNYFNDYNRLIREGKLRRQSATFLKNLKAFKVYLHSNASVQFIHVNN